MNAISKQLIGLSGFLILLLEGCLAADSRSISLYHGCSDPSTAVAIDNRYFVAGDDEHNILRMYSLSSSPDPVFSLDISGYLNVDAEYPEADIEASARMGQRIYWITSHGRNKDGKIRSSRYRFFATDIRSADPNQPPQLVPVGKACSTLVFEMLDCPQLSQLRLQDVTCFEKPLTKKQQAQLAPKEKGLNIEGLAVGPDGESLWIALRNPLHRDNSGKSMAIIIPLLNPSRVLEDGQKAVFGLPVLLDLEGRGIRSIEYQDNQGDYCITAGSVDSQANFTVFRYHPRDAKLTTYMVEFPEKFTPEGVFALPGQPKLCFISDDGTIPKQVQSPTDCMEGQLLPDGFCPNKFLIDMNQRTFRVLIVDILNPNTK